MANKPSRSRRLMALSRSVDASREHGNGFEEKKKGWHDEDM